MTLRTAALLATLLALPGAAHAAVPATPAGTGARIVYQGDPGSPGFGTILITGLDARALESLSELTPGEPAWEWLFSVRTGGELPSGGIPPAVLGSWSVEEKGIRFTPRFPLASGLPCTARFDGPLFDALTGHAAAGTPVLDLGFTTPEPALSPTTRVTAVYPAAEILPENLLRLYVQFSAPMRTQVIPGKVRLYDDRGEEVPLPFVEIRRGLWDPEQRRLTLFFHPGRIKRGVGPNEAMGPPLREGRTYRLVVGTDLVDAQGFPLARPYERIFRVGPPDRSAPDPASWAVYPPGDPWTPVVVDLGEPLDHALLGRLVRVETARGEPVSGSVTLARDDSRWSFVPDAPWRPGRYAVVVEPEIEDLAGNSLVRLFDAEKPGGAGDAMEVAASRGGKASVRIPFEVDF